MASAPSGALKTAAPEQRLREALAQLMAGDDCEFPTAKALCSLAGVSRNALYRYHPDILIDLHRLQRRRQSKSAPSVVELQRLRIDNSHLHQQLTMTAALVDHYFAAWQEIQTLLERRERELADLRLSIKPKIASIGQK